MIETLVRGLVVTLCPAELAWTRRVGERRQAQAEAMNGKPRFQPKTGTFADMHTLGARTELTVAWVTGKLWLPRDVWVGEHRRPRTTWAGSDIEGTNWEVRWTARAWACRPGDRGKVIVAVNGSEPTFTLVGWVFPARVLADSTLKHRDAKTGEDYWLFEPADILRHGRLGVPPHDHMEDR